MLKSLIHITLAMTLIMNSMVYSVIKASFTMNRQYIVENFCVNRDKPEMKCDGKCYLAQKIQEEKDRQESIPGLSFSKDFGVFIPIAIDQAKIDLIFHPTTPQNASYQDSLIAQAMGQIDHPPQS